MHEVGEASQAQADAPKGRHGGAEQVTEHDINGKLLKVREKWKEEEHLWPAAVVLARYITRTENVPAKGSNIVEVGAGCGLVSLALATVVDESCKIVATDCSKEALRNMRRNSVENKIGGRLQVEEWDWKVKSLPRWAIEVDLLVGSDMVFGNLARTSAYFHLSKAIAEMMSPKSACGQARAHRRDTGEAQEKSGRKAPQAVFLLQVRGDFEDSAVKAFVDDLQRRKLEVHDLSFGPEDTAQIPAETIRCLKLFRVSPPPDGGDLIDFTDPEGGCAGSAGWQDLDSELLAWADAADT